jgi:hypothetical protein
MIASITPWSPRKAARVTTNDGIPSRATSSPMQVPITAPVARQARIDGMVGHPWLVETTPRTAAAVPPVKPADRSISPSRRTNTRPIAMTVTPAVWLIRFAKFAGFVKLSAVIEKAITRNSRPRIAGRAPTSPPRILTTYDRTMPLRVARSSSGATIEGASVAVIGCLPQWWGRRPAGRARRSDRR